MSSLVVATGSSKGKAFELPTDRDTVIGRVGSCDLSVFDRRMSRRHCVVTPGPDGFIIKDLGSSNGVTINGKNYRLRWVQGRVRRMGFYKTRYLEAPNAKAAERTAVQAILDDPRWEGILLNAPDDPPRMYMKTIVEIASFSGISNMNPGYVFYPDDEKGNASNMN